MTTVYVPAVAVLKVATVEQVNPPVMHDPRLNVGATKPLAAVAANATLSTPLKPGKPFSPVAVIVAVGPGEFFVVVKLFPLEVMATHAGWTLLLNKLPV